MLILFKSYNVEQMFKVLALDDPFAQNIDKRKEVSKEPMLCCPSCPILKIMTDLWPCAVEKLQFQRLDVVNISSMALYP